MQSNTQNYGLDNDRKALIPLKEIPTDALFETKRGHIGVYALFGRGSLARNPITNEGIHTCVYSFIRHFLSTC